MSMNIDYDKNLPIPDFLNYYRRWRHVIAYMVDALCYKPEGRWFETRLCHCILFTLPNLSNRTMALGFIQPKRIYGINYI
jgi:hypothetical protein